jgi:putative transcriptional regulator
VVFYSAKAVLANNLRHYRDLKHLSQDELASKAGISLRLLQQIESGKGNPTLDTAIALSASLELTGMQLFSLENVRLEVDEVEFLSRYRKAFLNSPYGVTLRNFAGTGIWGNRWLSKVHGGAPLDAGPFSLLDLYEPDARAFFERLVELENKGQVRPYTVLFKQTKRKELIPLRSQPAVVFTRDGRARVFIALFIQELGTESEPDYYDFCAKLMDCVAKKPKGKQEEAAKNTPEGASSKEPG